MKEYKSEMRMVMRQDAALLHDAGLISDERMRRFDAACLVPEAPHVPFPAHESDRRQPDSLARCRLKRWT